MYDDYDLDYAIESICHESSFDLDEYMLDTYDIDEDYMRDSHDYQDLAYRHYA